MTGAVAYDPNDPLQSNFLSALALGETGGAPNAANEGFGGTNLTGAATDEYGFPQWSGNGTSHAAGTYQFEPSTWAKIASAFNLNFQNPQDQNAGAWYEAQQTYASATGGQSLEAALSAGDYSSVQAALQSVWPSVTGNAAAPAGLASDIASNTGAAIGGSTANAGSGVADTTPAPTGIIGAIENFFVRFGLIILGSLVILVSLYFLLSNAKPVHA